MLKKLTLSLLASLILFSGSLGLFAESAHAQWYKPNFDNFVALVEGNGNDTELFGERYTAAQVRWIMYSMLYVILPDPVRCFITASTGSVLSDACRSSLISLFNYLSPVNLPTSSNNPGNTLVNSLSNNPMSSITYFRSIGAKLNIIPEAQAQGFGFEAGALIFSLWEASRNVAYSLLIIVIIVMAFMIMFRVKLSPQTVISVQSALPKVITTLILITFSYAIAGLMIDVMYVSIGLLTTILRTANIIDVSTANWGDTFGELTWNNGAMELMLKYWALFQIALFSALSSNIPGAVVSGVAIALSVIFAGGIPLLIIPLISAIVVFIIGFRVWWMLIKNFVMLLFSIVLGPFQILLGALSNSGGFGPWARNMAGLLAVYPVTGFMFVLSFVFLRGAYENGLTEFLDTLIPGTVGSNIWAFDVASTLSNTNAWTPPLTGTPSDLNIIWLGASIAILALVPRTAEMIKGFMTGRPLAYGSAIGESLAITGAMGWGAGQWASSTQQAKFKEAEAAAAAAGKPISRGAQFLNTAGNVIRSASGGKIK